MPGRRRVHLFPWEREVELDLDGPTPEATLLTEVRVGSTPRPPQKSLPPAIPLLSEEADYLPAPPGEHCPLVMSPCTLGQDCENCSAFQQRFPGTHWLCVGCLSARPSLQSIPHWTSGPCEGCGEEMMLRVGALLAQKTAKTGNTRPAGTSR